MNGKSKEEAIQLKGIVFRFILGMLLIGFMLFLVGSRGVSYASYYSL